MGSLLSLIGVLCAVVAGAIVGYMMKAKKTIAQMIAAMGAWFIVTWLLIVVGTLLGLHNIYIQIYTALETAGWAPNVYLLKATVGLLTGFGSFVVSAIVTSLVTLRHKRFVILMTMAYCAMCLVLYALSRPQPGQVANVVTGAPLVSYYKNPDGRIEIFGIELRFHPRYPGVPVAPITPEIYREYERQQEQQKNGAPLSWVSFSVTPRWVEAAKGDLNLWVEGVEVNDRVTLLHMACAGRTGYRFSGEGQLIPGYEIYATDQDGRMYRLKEETTEYPQEKAEDKKTVVKAPRRIAKGEIFRYVLTFPVIPKETTLLVLYHGQFSPLRIRLKTSSDLSVKGQKLFGSGSIHWLSFKLSPSHVFPQGFVGGEDGQNISLWVEQVGITGKFTVLNLLARTGMDRRLYSAEAGKERTYLVDNNGEKYRLVLDLGDYQAEDAGPPFRTLSSEDYRFQLAFARLGAEVSKFTFYHWQFGPVTVDISEPQEDTVPQEGIQKTGGP